MKRVFALLLLLSPLLCISQITYQPGYFIENGVKTECLIKNLAWKNNPVSIEYKFNENDEPKQKTIKQISQFSVNDAYNYIRFTVNVDRSGTSLDKLSDRKEPEWSKETLFLNLLVDGKARLYQYEDGDILRYFFSTGNHSEAEQLVFKEFLINNDVDKNNMYRQQLYNTMKNGDNIDRFRNIKYKKNELVTLFMEYNGIAGQKATDNTKKQNRGSLNLKITPGLSFNSLVVDNPISNSYFSFAANTQYRIGAELECIMPFNNNKWSLFLDPNYQSFKNTGRKGNQQMAVQYDYVEIPVGVRHYMFLNQNSKFFVDGAYVMAIPFGDSYVQYGGSKLSIENNSALAFGVGFSYKRYSIEARYNVKHNLLKYAYWSAGHSSTAIILGYKIF